MFKQMQFCQQSKLKVKHVDVDNCNEWKLKKLFVLAWGRVLEKNKTPSGRPAVRPSLRPPPVSHLFRPRPLNTLTQVVVTNLLQVGFCHWPVYDCLHNVLLKLQKENVAVPRPIFFSLKRYTTYPKSKCLKSGPAQVASKTVQS